MSYQSGLGTSDVDIMTLATTIEASRKIGWDDAKIASSLQNSESSKNIAAAFEYLRSKTFPAGTTFIVTKAPVITVAKPSSGGPPWVPIVIGAGILGVLLLWRK